jgi:glycosyltransferase involved in cell wall biosynthesis
VQPEVTVVIPTHERRDRIGPTLAGALAQEDVELEVIVVDDCSADGTAERLRELDDPRLSVLRNETNMRQAATRNRGIDAARGEWVALLDDDDLWAPRKLREQLDAARGAGAELAFSTALLIDRELRPLDVYPPPSSRSQPQEILRHYSVPAGCSNLLVRAELLRAVGGFDEDLDPGSDWDLFIRLLLEGSSTTLPDLHVGYVQHAATMSSGHLERQFADFERNERRYREVRNRYGVEIDGVEFSRWLAGGLRRAGRRADAIRAYLRGARRYRSAGNVVRAAGVLLGERALALGAPRSAAAAEAVPEWLDLFRPGGRLDLSLDQLGAVAD